MKNEPVRLGWLSILLVVVILCMAIFGVLSLSTARADLRLAKMQAEQVEARYLQESEGEQWIADMTQRFGGKPVNEGVSVPEGTSLANSTLSTVIEDEEGHTLSIEIDVSVPAPYPVLVWKHGSVWTADDGMSGIWDGA